MTKVLHILLGFCLIMLTACSNSEDKRLATKIITNGSVWTGNEMQPWAETIVIEGDRIVAVGGPELADAFIAEDTIDARGKLVLPGFIDNHVHFMDGSNELVSVQTIKAKSTDEFTEIIKAYAADMTEGEWMRGGIWDHETWGGIMPRKEWVDDFSQNIPILLYRTDGHIAFVNSKALELAGITRETEDPVGGVIVRDENGEPTGVLIDNAMYLVSKLAPAPNDQQIDAMFDEGIKEALENGVTQVHSIDMGVWDNLPIFKRAKEQNRLKIRTYFVSHISKRHELAEMIEKEGRGDNWLRFGGVKAMADGALGSGTAWFYEPFDDEPDNSGFPIRPMDELKQMIRESHEYGLQLVIHGIGDKANDELLKIFKEIDAGESRPRIEHAQHIRKSSLPKFAELGVIAAAHPYHVYDDGRFAQTRIGNERIKELYSFKSLFDAGATVSFGSDWFVAPLKPLLGIYVAVTRHTADGKNPDGWMPQEKITVEQAVRAYTINNAYAGHQEDVLGTIEAGKLADIVILSDNIFEIPPEKIADVRVDATIIGGKLMYEAH